MALAADQYITQAILDDSKYVQGGRRVVQTDAAMAQSSRIAQSSIGATAMSLGSMVTVATTAATAIAAAYGAVVTAFAQLGVAGLKAYADIEQLSKGLEATEGSAKAAAERMKELRELAKAPGLGFQESVNAYVKLTGAGASPAFAQRLIMEGANANARVGGGRESFDRILLALSQAMTKRTFEGQDARQLADANIPIYDILRRRFGSGDTAELADKGVTSAQVLNALVDEWSQLQRVSGGLKNSFENLQDTGAQALASFGEGLADLAGNGLSSLTTEVETLTNSGVFKMLGTDLANSVENIMSVFDGGGIGGLRGVSLSLIGTFAYLKSTVEGYTIVMSLATQRMVDIYGITKDAIKTVANSIIPGSGNLVDLINAGAGITGGIHQGAMQQAASAIEAAQNLIAAYERKGAMKLGAQIGSALAPEPPKPEEEKNAFRLERIAQATEKMAGIFDKSAFGGGDILRKGISIIDATSASKGSGMGGSYSRSGNADQELGRLIDARIRRQMAGNQ